MRSQRAPSAQAASAPSAPVARRIQSQRTREPLSRESRKGVRGPRGPVCTRPFSLFRFFAFSPPLRAPSRASDLIRQVRHGRLGRSAFCSGRIFRGGDLASPCWPCPGDCAPHVCDRLRQKFTQPPTRAVARKVKKLAHLAFLPRSTGGGGALFPTTFSRTQPVHLRSGTKLGTSDSVTTNPGTLESRKSEGRQAGMPTPLHK